MVFTTIEILHWLTISSIVIQLFYWVGYVLSLRNHKRKDPGNIVHQNDVSIIVCAHNEAENLKRNLPYFLHQKGVNFELIVVDDHSSDETAQILKDFKKNYPTLVIVNAPSPKTRGKKAALRAGIEAAKFDRLILSDADCRPEENWANIMSNHFNESHEIVIGFSPFEEKPGPVNAFARFENVLTAFQYFGLGLSGHPYMGVGRNLGYSKRLISQMKYFDLHADHIAGDDDLTVQAGLKHTKASFTLDPQSFVSSSAVETMGNYFRQKLRHYSVSGRYPMKTQIILGLFMLTWSTFYVGIILLAFLSQYNIVLTLLLMRWIMLVFGFKVIQNTFRQRFKLVQIIVFDVVYPILIGILTIFGLLKTNKNWK